jgi:ribonuclease J
MLSAVSETLRLVPLGGLGEIGMNCMALECEGDIVVVDCGVMFPDRELGVDVVHPRFDWLAARRDRVRAVLVTHGHEDHIGALPYLARELDAPIYGPPYALELIKARFSEREHDGLDRPELVATRPGQRFRVGAFEVEPIRVTHSIPDATALALHTKAGTVVHTGDFKIDEAPADGEVFDEARLRALGDEGVRLLLSDSTNAWSPGESGPERDVAEALAHLVARAEKRVIVSLFASNVHRLRALLDIARETGRVACLLGRSLERHLETAIATGYLRDPAGLVVPPEAAKNVARERLLVLATGTQGEAPAALSRLAEDRHPALTLEPGDEVILSARIIPGNEQHVFSLVNHLERRGIRCRFRTTDPEVHVSGHAHAGEQKRMIELVRPDAFLPVHGTFLHLRRHAELAESLGVKDTLVVENGAVVELSDQGLAVVDQTVTGRVHVDAGEEIPDVVLRDRARLAELGIALVVIPVDRRGSLAGHPDVITRGVVDEEEETELLADARAFVADELEGYATPKRDLDDEELADIGRRALKRYFARHLGRKPLTYGVVVRVPARAERP